MAIMEHVHTNGQRGRIAPTLPQHTFKDSNITIHYRKIGPTTRQQVAQAIMEEDPAPPIPVVKTELGDEPNAADPAYIQSREAWEQRCAGTLSQRLLLIAAVEAEVTIDDRARAEIARRKRSLKVSKTPYEDNPDLTEEENERVFYVLHVAASSPEDMGEFGEAILKRSVPTEGVVQQHIATFQRDIPE